MDNSLQQIFTDKIDNLTYKLYKTEQQILNMEEMARQRWSEIYEPRIHTRDYIKYRTLDEYYNHVICSRRYHKLINKKMLIESELGFCHKHINEINNMILC